MKGSEIQNLVFSVSIMGYKKSDVKVCLKEISEYVLKLENKLYSVEVERDKLKDKLNKSEINQSNFKEIIASAQEFKSRIESESQKKASEVIQSAKNEAKDILTNAQKQYEEIAKAIRGEKSKLSLMKREVEGVRRTILGKLGDFVNMLEFKEKNDFARTGSPFRPEKEDLINKDFESKKTVKITDDKQQEEKLKEKNEKYENLDSSSDEEVEDKNKNYPSEEVLHIDNNYIKSRFSEIEYR